MEYITFKPIIEPQYNTNLVKSILTFSAFNYPQTVTASLINNRLVINIKRGKTTICFLLNKPFDYPNNFDYFQLSCSLKYSDMTTINEFIQDINNFIKRSIVNLSFGYILEYIHSKKEIISENLELIPEVPDVPDVPEVPEVIPLLENINIETKTKNSIQHSKQFNSYESFYTNLFTIKLNEYELYRNKILTQEQLTPQFKISFELIFTDILKTFRELMSNIYPKMFNDSEKQIKIIYLKSLLNFRIIVPPAFIRTTYKFDIQISDNMELTITPYYPIIDSNPLKFLNNGTMYDTILNYINNTVKCKKPYQEYVEEENFNVEYSIPLFNIMRIGHVDYKNPPMINKLNYNIKQFIHANFKNKKTTQEKHDLAKSIFKNHGWIKGMESISYISNTISKLKIARFLENKEYYNILIMIIIFSWNDFKEFIELDKLKIQYTHFLNLKRDPIESFDSLFKLFENK